METEAVRCPGCGEAMTIAVNRAVTSREYVCDHCGGAVAGVAVFRHLLDDQQVAHIWSGETASDDTKPPRCGFCLAYMEPRALERGHAAICKTCQVIWFDKEALDSLTTTVQTHALSEVGVSRCSYCGAAITSPLDERCRYCGKGFDEAPVVAAPTSPITTG
jgi:rubrerythrin